MCGEESQAPTARGSYLGVTTDLLWAWGTEEHTININIPRQNI